MDNMNNKILSSINQLIAASRKNKRITFILISISLSSVSAGIALFLSLSLNLILYLMALVLVGSFLFQIRSRRYLSININSMLEHINCTFLEFEQSSQLLLENQPNSILQRLQKRKVEQLFKQQQILNKIHQSIAPVEYKSALKILLISIILFAVQQFTDGMYSPYSKSSPPTNILLTTAEKISEPKLLSSTIVITPPEYMNRKTIQTSDMNLHIMEGSEIRWRLDFSRKDITYYMVNSEGHRIQIKHQENNKFEYLQVFSQSSLYSFAYMENGQFTSLDDVYTIAVTMDQLPKIKITKPNQSLVEIPKLGPANFELEVKISDDFGLSKTFIQASVASGSGEAVKFRDEVFNFDETQTTAKESNFKKHWDLQQLKMEPGDEVYFKVITEDNKQPDAQQVKSSSIIVRWLDNEIQQMAADGLRINFVPEYFRSQRQIIIETEQLIEDRKDLSQQQINELSRSLGHSQNDLKAKYGEYLGDEVGEGLGEEVSAVAALEHQGELGEDDQEHDETQPEIGHAHEEMIDHNDRSGSSELIARFTHNHGSTEIGPMSKLDPKSWMKKAVNEMWQAELHLMLSEPERALEFEYKAYDYLKLATAAERIYVKRLGFEPPPVNEDTRLTGELKDILSYSSRVEDNLDTGSNTVLLQSIFSLLSDPKDKPLNITETALLKDMKQWLLVLSESRPALIKQAATIERILSSDSIAIKKCNQCISNLKQKIWQLMPAAKSQPNITNTQKNSELENQYQSNIQGLKKSSRSKSTIIGDRND
jgi:hypothetical protein